MPDKTNLLNCDIEFHQVYLEKAFLDYAILGLPGDEPVLYFHGCPGSRLEALMLTRCAPVTGCTFYAPTRPGYGSSLARNGSRQDHSLKNWATIIKQFMERIGLSSCSILAVSGGAPYALACSHFLADRIKNISIVCGLGPLHGTDLGKQMMRITRSAIYGYSWLPWMASPVFSLLRKLIRANPEKAVRLLARFAPAPDDEVLTDTNFHKYFSQSVGESMATSYKGIAHDITCYTRDWGFSLEDISVPVTLWYGDKDVTVPISHGEYLHKHIPNSTMYSIPDEGHFSLPVRWGSTILEHLLSTDS